MLPDLPLLVLKLVCDHLSYEDLLMLRCVCKPLKQFVDGKQFTKLQLFIENYSFHRRLFYTGDSTGHQHSLHSDSLDILDSSRFRESFSNVRRMTICWKHFPFHHRPTELDLNRLNCFAALRHLEVDEFHSLNGQLNLKELQIAAFECKYAWQIFGLIRPPDPPSFELNCPKLRALKIRQCRPVLSAETDQLNYVDYDDFLSRSPPDFLSSINLQRISTICFKRIERLLRFLDDLRTSRLSAPSLSELKLERWHKDFERLDELAASLEDLQRLSEFKRCTRRIRLILNGRPIGTPDELRQISSIIQAHFGNDESDRMLHGWLGVRSISLLSEKPELRCLLSAGWEVQILEKVELNEETTKHLKCIQTLGFYRPNHQFSFGTIELLARNCKMLRSWSFSDQVVTEQLLEMMSKHLVNLMYLRIDECRYETTKPLAKFRNLDTVSFDFDPGRDEVTHLFENSRTLEKIMIVGKDLFELLRRSKLPREHKIHLHPQSSSAINCLRFESLSAMIDHYLEQGLFKKRDQASSRMRSWSGLFEDLLRFW